MPAMLRTGIATVAICLSALSPSSFKLHRAMLFAWAKSPHRGKVPAGRKRVLPLLSSSRACEAIRLFICHPERSEGSIFGFPIPQHPPQPHSNGTASVGMGGKHPQPDTNSTPSAKPLLAVRAWGSALSPSNFKLHRAMHCTRVQCEHRAMRFARAKRNTAQSLAGKKRGQTSQISLHSICAVSPHRQLPCRLPTQSRGEPALNLPTHTPTNQTLKNCRF